jgi:hypothetical protein
MSVLHIAIGILILSLTVSSYPLLMVRMTAMRKRREEKNPVDAGY